MLAACDVLCKLKRVGQGASKGEIAKGEERKASDEMGWIIGGGKRERERRREVKAKTPRDDELK